jgi:L-ascorbate metabolism protein UlaG (beta-lactamase superfamily)
MRPSFADLRHNSPCLAASVLLVSLIFIFPCAATDKLHFRFIGNEAFAIADGNTTLLTDFPYTPGAFGYMPYDFAAFDGVENGLCLITHGHADHFDPKLFATTKFAIIAPPSVLASLDTSHKIPFAAEMTYRGITVKAFRTPHGDIEHYSFLVLWHGLEMYFAGDTDDVAELGRQADLDVAFVTPWQLKAMLESGKRIGARRVVLYHHHAGEDIPAYQERCVLKQGESFELRAPEKR